MMGALPRCAPSWIHYDSFLATGLSDDEKNDLVAYLKTL